jgi:hypothetical protein
MSDSMRLFSVVSTMGDYCPPVFHAYVGSEPTDEQIRGSANELVSALADDLIWDGESSSDAAVADEDVADEDAAGDGGMVKLWGDGREAYREAVDAIVRALRSDPDGALYSYGVNWSCNLYTTVYAVVRADGAVCSDAGCEICWP